MALRALLGSRLALIHHRHRFYANALRGSLFPRGVSLVAPTAFAVDVERTVALGAQSSSTNFSSEGGVLLRGTGLTRTAASWFPGAWNRLS